MRDWNHGMEQESLRNVRVRQCFNIASIHAIVCGRLPTCDIRILFFDLRTYESVHGTTQLLTSLIIIRF